MILSEKFCKLSGHVWSLRDGTDTMRQGLGRKLKFTTAGSMRFPAWRTARTRRPDASMLRCGRREVYRRLHTGPRPFQRHSDRRCDRRAPLAKNPSDRVTRISIHSARQLRSESSFTSSLRFFPCRSSESCSRSLFLDRLVHPRGLSCQAVSVADQGRIGSPRRRNRLEAGSSDIG